MLAFYDRFYAILFLSFLFFNVSLEHSSVFGLLDVNWHIWKVSRRKEGGHQ